MMNNLKKTMCLVCIAAILTVAMCGCKQNTDDDSGETPTTITPTTVTADKTIDSYAAAGTLTAGDSYVGKGFVFLNCDVTVQAGATAYMGRTGGSSYYDQGAFINTKFTQNGTLSNTFWYGTSTAIASIMDNAGNYHVGWKDYNSADATTGITIATTYRYTKSGTITADLYTAEYSERSKILNRVFDITTPGYADEASSNQWDISALVTEFSAN
jgi:hypothetical protein